MTLELVFWFAMDSCRCWLYPDIFSGLHFVTLGCGVLTARGQITHDAVDTLLMLTSFFRVGMDGYQPFNHGDQCVWSHERNVSCLNNPWSNPWIIHFLDCTPSSWIWQLLDIHVFAASVWWRLLPIILGAEFFPQVLHIRIPNCPTRFCAFCVNDHYFWAVQALLCPEIFTTLHLVSLGCGVLLEREEQLTQIVCEQCIFHIRVLFVSNDHW